MAQRPSLDPTPVRRAVSGAGSQSRIGAAWTQDFTVPPRDLGAALVHSSAACGGESGADGAVGRLVWMAQSGDRPSGLSAGQCASRGGYRRCTTPRRFADRAIRCGDRGTRSKHSTRGARSSIPKPYSVLEANLAAIDQRDRSVPARACSGSVERYLNTHLAEARQRKLAPAPPRDARWSDRKASERSSRLVMLTTAVLLSAARAGAAGRTAGPPPQTDQTVPATRGMRLIIDNSAGEVVVHAWDKDSVRVQARHSTGRR